MSVWLPDDVDAGQQLDAALASVGRFLRRYVVLSDAQTTTLALWAAHTWAIGAAETTPYIAVTSAEKRSGKTRLLETLELVVRTPLVAANISDAALFRAIGELKPTILFDEIDAIFGPKARDREDLRGMLNAGYRRGAVALRMGGQQMRTLERFPVFAAKAFAGIGDCLPDTIRDRSIPIRLQRRVRDEHVDRFRRREVEPGATALRRDLSDAVEACIGDITAARPQLPDELDDRAQDVWEPLFAIADVAGAGWAASARRAAVELSSGGERQDESLTARLIGDVHAVFAETGETRMRTADLIHHLSGIEEAPWGDWYGKPISAQQLSRLLKPYRIQTMPVRANGETVRGYKVEQFADAFLRVVGVTRVTPVTPLLVGDAASNGRNACNAGGAGDGLEADDGEVERLAQLAEEMGL